MKAAERAVGLLEREAVQIDARIDRQARRA